MWGYGGRWLPRDTQGYAGPRKCCRTPSESPPQGRGGDPAPTPDQGHGPGGLWYHLKHPPPPQIREWHFITSFGEALKHPQTPPVQAAPRTWGGDGHKKLPSPISCPSQRLHIWGAGGGWGSMAAPRLRLYDCLAEGGGHQTQPPQPQFLAEKEEENPRGGQNPREGRKSSRSRGWHRNLSPPVQRACPFSAPQLPTAAIQRWFSQSKGGSGPPWRAVVSCHDPGHLSFVAWLYQAPSRELPLVPAKGTMTNGSPPAGHSCKRWTKLAGKTPVREPSPSMKPTWGCRKRVQEGGSLISRYQPPKLLPCSILTGIERGEAVLAHPWSPASPPPRTQEAGAPHPCTPRKTQPPSEENWRGKRTRIWIPAPVHGMVTHPDLLVLLPCHHNDLALGEGQLSCLVPLAVSHGLHPLLPPLGLKWDDKGVTDPPRGHPKGANRDTTPDHSISQPRRRGAGMLGRICTYRSKPPGHGHRGHLAESGVLGATRALGGPE